MGAFCVFGVSRSHCRKQAEKNVMTFAIEQLPHPPHTRRRELTVVEWSERVQAEAGRLFEATDKQVRISPELDAPQFCEDWIAAAPGETKLTKIMCRGDKIDKHGAIVMRGGMAVQAWLDYDPNAARKIPAHPPQFAWASEGQAAA